jgi:hypothetical protein
MSWRHRVHGPRFFLLAVLFAACSANNPSNQGSTDGGRSGGSGGSGGTSVDASGPSSDSGRPLADGANGTEAGRGDGARSDSGTRSSTPKCGLNNDQNPYVPGTYPTGASDWDTFAAPAAGGSYVDSLSGCTFTRITDSVTDGVGYSIYYSSVSPFSADNKLIMLGFNGIKTGPADSSHAPGTTVIPGASIPRYNADPPIWDGLNPHLFYYTSQSSLMSGTIEGLPGCIASKSCAVATATLHDFTGKYGSVAFNDEPDLSQDGTTLLLVGANADTTIDILTWDLKSASATVWYTTVDCKGELGVQSGAAGCMHKLQLTPNNEPIVTWEGASGPERGMIWYHGTPGSATQTQLADGGTPHLDTGLDLSSNPVYIINGWGAGNNDPCPANQWPGQAGGGGEALTPFSNPVAFASICNLSVDWAPVHISYRGGPSQPWIATAFDDVRTISSEWFSSNANYIAPTCTQTHPTDSGSCWYPYQDEILMSKVSTNMTTPGTSALSTVYRMGWGRSRSHENFWAQNIPSLSHDGGYIALDTNMAHPAGCSASIQNANGCTDVFVISAANGAPLF